MTLVVGWIAVDSRKPSSIYLTSDSRITYSTIGYHDQSKKIFACKDYPDIFALCGSYTFPQMILSQIVSLIDLGMVFSKEDPSDQKSKKVANLIQNSFLDYPKDAVSQNIKIAHFGRDLDGNFHTNLLHWSKYHNMWREESVNEFEVSEKIFVLGSGAKEFNENYKKYLDSEIKNTSRSIFQCFTETLKSINDPYCGGGPQLAGIYNKFPAKNIGTIYNGQRFLEGMKINLVHPSETVQWRNELFERCDGLTMSRLNGAQRQPNPFL